MLINIKTVVLLTYAVLCVKETLCYPPPVPVDILMSNLEHLSQQLENSRIPIEHRRLFFRPLLKNVQGKTRELFSRFIGTPASTRPSGFSGPTESTGLTGSTVSSVTTVIPINNTQGPARSTERLSVADQPSDIAGNINSQRNSESTVDRNAEERQITEEPNRVDLDSYDHTDIDVNNDDDELSIRILPQPVVATLLG
ncbi:uncharacterized protein LOC112054555 [Bicyclus anynana]|uniref:Uncharacterized protein LOC112054555 n=1 Tax=Bicyclus anynana TaxID=110368 RepID=A0A6J1NZB4_BICAN|nr:uncharacterized protein LOC112054555 [Bicyclus anynana]